MGHPLRFQSPAVFQHITARGNDRQPLFLDSRDFEKYLAFLDAALRLFNFEVHALCLMLNHLHLLCRFPLTNMDEVMEIIHGRYARWFNHRYNRVGHVFEKRYYNRVVNTEGYLHEVGRYIHNNPVKEGLCAAPEEYQWSSFREIWDSAPVHTTGGNILTRPFTSEGKFDRDALRGFTLARICDSEEDEWYEDAVHKPDERKSAGPDPLSDPRVPPILEIATLDFGLDRGELSAPSHSPRVLNARALAAYLLRQLTVLTLWQIGVLIGLHYPTSVLKSLRRAKELIARDQIFADRVARGIRLFQAS
ncbi:MAG: transposase [Elusimicrobia bacterium]|nr:transposase [Elusimicrobiota bacterium]